MSNLHPKEQAVVTDVTALITRYITAYVHSDRDAFRTCFHSEMSTAIGERYVPNSVLRQKPKDQPHYFELRKGHWKPPLRTRISVRPLNWVTALARVHWVFPEAATGLQYSIISLYMCVKTDDGWKVHMTIAPTESGESLVTEDATYQEWDVERWAIYKDE